MISIYLLFSYNCCYFIYDFIYDSNTFIIVTWKTISILIFSLTNHQAIGAIVKPLICI